jgi:hypothetical protein
LLGDEPLDQYHAEEKQTKASKKEKVKHRAHLLFHVSGGLTHLIMLGSFDAFHVCRCAQFTECEFIVLSRFHALQNNLARLPAAMGCSSVNQFWQTSPIPKRFCVR